MTNYPSVKYEGIVTCEEDAGNILRKPTSFLQQENWDQAQLTIQKLRAVRNNILKGGAGLAAPQIGILLPIFIYTPDRTTESLIDVINPSFETMGTETLESYEACFQPPFAAQNLGAGNK